MKSKSTILGLLIVPILVFGGVVSAAIAPTLAVPAGLSFAQIKMTGNEFVMLQNNTDSTVTDLSQYWLYGFNNVNPLAPGVNNSSQQLPQGRLEPGQTVLLTQNGGPTCGAAITARLSISLTDSSGYMQVVKSELINNVLIQTSGDAVSWSSGTNNVPGMIANVPSNTAAPRGAWYRYKNTGLSPPYLWQKADVDAEDSCQLNITIDGSTVKGPNKPGRLLLPGVPPPATIVSIPIETNGPNGIPPSDIGLMAPVVTELLPNPASPGTDSEDEFIELYNPNDKTFDLSGFKLQTKSNTSQTKRTYSFPGGTKIPPKKFAAYPSSEISISLNNNGAQVWLLDPSANVISQTDPYTKSKEGYSWALADNKWYWTAKPTAGATNIIDGSSTGSANTGNGTGTVLGSSTSNNGNGTNKPGTKEESATPLHSAVLVGVGILALLYGIYEYKGDMANAIYKFKRNRANRREARAKT